MSIYRNAVVVNAAAEFKTSNPPTPEFDAEGLIADPVTPSSENVVPSPATSTPRTFVSQPICNH